MGNKSAAREAKKALSQKKFDEGKSAFISKVFATNEPKQIVSPALNTDPRLAKNIKSEGPSNSPKAIKDGSRFSCLVTWCNSKADIKDSWSWGEFRNWTDEEWNNIIHPPFKEFEKLTWREIDIPSSDTGHKMHHSHEVSDLIDEAQERWKALNLEEYDTLFRFRLGGQKCRAWGFVVQAHFHLVWWDRNHSIYKGN